ncbi:hypothetical protein [Thermococcus sp.]|uniref:hypothetical protein n=1 Tax=Thermococcus sp. TaxID=35749 RepID=UPI002615F1DF|nr:hypothetical protein [Thermococcus sp.]
MKRGIKLLAGSALFLLLVIPTVAAGKVVDGINVVTSVSPGEDDFFISVSTYAIIAHPLNFTLGGAIIHGSVIPTEIIFEDSLPDWMFLFYVSREGEYYIWSGNYLDYLGISPPAAFYSNGSWYLFLYGGAPHIMINDRPFSKVYPYNLSLNNPMIFEIKNGCITPTPVTPYHQITHGTVRLEKDKLVVSFPGEGRIVSIPLSSFKGYFHIVNATAFAESLRATKLENDAIVLHFPALSYFPGNSTTYAGTFRGNEFVPIFESKEMTDYVFLFRETLEVIPVLNFGDRVTPLVTGTYELSGYDSTVISSSTMASDFTASSSSGRISQAFLLALIIGILVGTFMGCWLNRRREENGGNEGS